MSESKKLLKGTAILTIGQIGGYALSFLRNVILARTLTKADYGLAALFGMTMTLLEVSGRMAFGTQIIQAKDGDTPKFQATAHALQFAGGLCSAVLIVCLSVPMARLFGVPNATWAFATLALVPVCQGLSHLDIARRQRNLDFTPLVLIDIIPQLTITAAAWPLAVWFGDYRVIVCLMICKAVMSMIISYSYALRPYRWAWERSHMHGMLTFGWPLLLNGLAMFASQQVDQMLVGVVFTLNVLASYALAFSTVSIPFHVFGHVLSSLMLPLMARNQDDTERLRRQYRLCAQFASVAGVLCLLPLISAGEQMVVLIYGVKYQGTGIFMAMLGAAAAFRFLRVAPSVAALARGDTFNQLYANLTRGISLPLALLVWYAGGTTAQIAACAMLGELMAVIVSIMRLRRCQGVPLMESFGASFFTIVSVSAGMSVALLGGENLTIWWAGVLTVATVTIALGLAWFMFPEVAPFLVEIVRKNSRGFAKPTTFS